MTGLSAQVKAKLSTTVRLLRERLLSSLREATQAHYRLSVPIEQAGLDARSARRRIALEAHLSAHGEARDHAWLALEKDVASTLLNRMVVLRHLEARGLSRPALLTGCQRSPAFAQFRAFAPALTHDSDEGFQRLLQLVFDELSIELPGLFVDTAAASLLHLPAPVLREVAETLDAPELSPAWLDDTTLGWVYQFWNDPEREGLDRKIAEGGKIEPDELASKTQMFTERFMVEWLLQNSLGPLWLRICAQHGHEPDLLATQRTLETRRSSWNAAHPQAPLPIEDLTEERWQYLLPCGNDEHCAPSTPRSVRDITLLDPACGSGHFLVIAFDALAALYREEARLTGVPMSDREIAEAIVERNLHGIDIDPRAVQIAAASLFLKAKGLSRDACPSAYNLVAPSRLLPSDAAVGELRTQLLEHLPEERASSLIDLLGRANHLGSLLCIEHAISQREPTGSHVLACLDAFFARHSSGDDLGVSAGPEQLSSGQRFLRLAAESRYDIVVANPPYQGTQRIADSEYLDKVYPRSKEDLYAIFIERALQLTKPYGVAALITIRSWMFVRHFQHLREHLLAEHRMHALADLGTAAFEAAPGVEAVMFVIQRAQASGEPALALSAPAGQRAELVSQRNRHQFYPDIATQIAGSPILYQWSRAFLERYLTLPKLGDSAPVRVGMKTSDNARFVRFPWEVSPRDVEAIRVNAPGIPSSRWVPYIKGASGKAWIEPLSDVVLWQHHGLQIRVALQHAYGQSPQCERLYFVPGVAFTTIARDFLARAHRFRSIFDVAGSSVFHADTANIVCLLNSKLARSVVEQLNPTINFQVGDVNRLPHLPIAEADAIFAVLERSFAEHEAARETSVEFRRPGPSSWQSAQLWAQQAVDRPAGATLPVFEPAFEAPSPQDELSFAFGVAMGRFAANGKGVLESTPPESLPGGVLFLSARADEAGHDTLAHPACDELLATWSLHGPQIAAGDSLRTYLRRDLFSHLREVYENRPIYWPLSSRQRSYVVWVNLHRWNEDTAQGASSSRLAQILADHLLPEQRAIESALSELREARASVREGDSASLDRLIERAQKLGSELSAFIDLISQCEAHGPPQIDREPAREADAKHVLHLDDGVLVNAAALWPLLDPQWKDPRRWWKELAVAEGRKDYDWSRTAARYFPARVASKCESDPSMAAAHGSLWKHHPALALSWEQRMSEKLTAPFVIDEPEAAEARVSTALAAPQSAKAPAKGKATAPAESRAAKRKRSPT